MSLFKRARVVASVAAFLSVMLWASPALAQTPQTSPLSPVPYPGLPSETPAKFTPVATTFDYVKRSVARVYQMSDQVETRTLQGN